MSVRRATTRRPKPKFEVGDEVVMKLKIVGVDKRYNPPVYRVLTTSMKTRYLIEQADLVKPVCCKKGHVKVRVCLICQSEFDDDESVERILPSAMTSEEFKKSVTGLRRRKK